MVHGFHIEYELGTISLFMATVLEENVFWNAMKLHFPTVFIACNVPQWLSIAP